MKVAILDYGTGNVLTLRKALEAGGAEVKLEGDATVAAGADAVVLPDAGALGAAAAHIGGAAPALRAALVGGLPCLAIGAGMHLLFESDSAGAKGLGMLRGRICALAAHRVPHMGWNSVESSGPGPVALLSDVTRAEFYFAHGGIAEAADGADVQATTAHEGKTFPAIVRRSGTWGVQFRPEKSGSAGLRLIRYFLESAQTRDA